MNTHPPLFSIVIPTWGKAQFLNQVLIGLQTQSETNFETIIVDNNDPPRIQIIDIERPCSSFRIVWEPRNGLSYARNAGIVHSNGKFIAFLDDDGVPDKDWLANLATGVDKYQADMIGGSVRLVLQESAPAWFSNELRGYLSELMYEGKDIANIGDDQYVVGANMCISNEACNTIGGFSHFFDRTATSLRSSGDLEYMKRLQANGYRVAFAASALVWHQIPKYRVQRKYLIMRAYWQGRSDALLEIKWGRPASFGHRNNWKNLLAIASGFRRLLFRREPVPRFEYFLKFVREVGYGFQYVLLTFDKKLINEQCRLDD